MDNHPTLKFPFGRDVDTLILCRNDLHRRRVIDALAIPAMYELLWSAMTGYRFQKIIVLAGDGFVSEVESAALHRLLEDLPIHLGIGGKMYVL